MLSRFIGDAGGAYENIAWANEFIDAADVEWNVLRDSAFSEKGSVRQFQRQIPLVFPVASNEMRTNDRRSSRPSVARSS